MEKPRAFGELDVSIPTPPTPESPGGQLAVSPAPPELRQRLVEINPADDLKMVDHALNSLLLRRRGFMADFEDAKRAHLRDMVPSKRADKKKTKITEPLNPCVTTYPTSRSRHVLRSYGRH